MEKIIPGVWPTASNKRHAIMVEVRVIGTTILGRGEKHLLHHADDSSSQ